MTFLEIFERELTANDATWCKGCGDSGSHTRGFAQKRVVHFDSAIATRKTLLGGLHEIGHIVLGHTSTNRGKRWEQERDATAWAIQKMREHRVPVPHAEVRAYDAYVERMKRWGENIAAGRSRRRSG